MFKLKSALLSFILTWNNSVRKLINLKFTVLIEHICYIEYTCDIAVMLYANR